MVRNVVRNSPTHLALSRSRLLVPARCGKKEGNTLLAGCSCAISALRRTRFAPNSLEACLKYDRLPFRDASYELLSYLRVASAVTRNGTRIIIAPRVFDFTTKVKSQLPDFNATKCPRPLTLHIFFDFFATFKLSLASVGLAWLLVPLNAHLAIFNGPVPNSRVITPTLGLYCVVPESSVAVTDVGEMMATPSTNAPENMARTKCLFIS